MKKIMKPLVFSLLSIMLAVNIINAPVPIMAQELSSNSKTNSIWPTGPDVFADGAIVMDADTGLVLYEKDSKSAYYPASITKIMTTLLALENCNISETMTMSHEAEWDVDFNSSRIGLVEGESLSLEDALYGVMLESANEVSYGVAEHVAHGTVHDFAKMMNERAKELGCINTHFTNPHGLHDKNHYTSAYDMALISRAAIQIPEFRTIIGTRTHTIPPTNKNVARPLANHHRFIRKTMHYDGAIGGKTGGTNEAKTTLVTFAERNGMTLIAVVLHVDTAIHAYEDTAKILDFSFDNYSVYPIEDTVSENSGWIFPSLFADIKECTPAKTNNLSIQKNSKVILPAKADPKDLVKEITYTPVNEFEHGNNIIGSIRYTYDGKFVGSANLLYYNSSFPLTKSEFDAQWPDYLIPPDLVFSEDPQPSQQTSSNTTQDATKDSVTTGSTPVKNTSKTKTILLVICIAAIIIVTGYYLLFIEIPHRRRKKIYQKNHKRRMASLHKQD